MEKYVKSIDQNILLYLNNLVKNWGFVNKFFAEYLIYATPIVLLWLWFYDFKAKKVALRAFTSVILAWPIIAYFVGKFFNRPRPFEVGGIQELLFHRPTYSFPSDHAAAIFALAASFWFSGYKKLGGAFFFGGIVICFFRVATGIHWPSDIVAGALIGILAAWIVDLLDKPLNMIYEFIIKIMQKIKLA